MVAAVDGYASALQRHVEKFPRFGRKSLLVTRFLGGGTDAPVEPSLGCYAISKDPIRLWKRCDSKGRGKSAKNEPAKRVGTGRMRLTPIDRAALLSWPSNPLGPNPGDTSISNLSNTVTSSWLFPIFPSLDNAFNGFAKQLFIGFN